MAGWFDEVLAGLARQDYANLKTLVLVTGDAGDVASRVAATVPRAFVRAVEGLDGFGRTANEVLRLVDGDNGFFCFLHDDVALEPDAIRLLVEEMYRSNAGIVGPKLVEWDDPTVLQHVGYAVDRFGEIDPLVEPGGGPIRSSTTRSATSSPCRRPACWLRADLFRSLGGFDPDISFHGEDVDLCWRAHHQGARVLVVPSARARHLEALEQRRPDLAHDVLRARHRMRTVASLTGIRRMPLLTVQMVLITLAQFIVGVFSGQGVAGRRRSARPRGHRASRPEGHLAATRRRPRTAGAGPRGGRSATAWQRTARCLPEVARCPTGRAARDGTCMARACRRVGRDRLDRDRVDRRHRVS